MTTTIEKCLARLALKSDGIDKKLDAMAQTSAPPSILSTSVRDINSLFAVAASDNVAGAAALLRTLVDPSNIEATSRNSFGKPAPTTVIDGEFTVMKSKEMDPDVP